MKNIISLALILIVANVAAFPDRDRQPYPGGNGHNDRETLRFKVLARDLKGKDTFGSIDPYIIITSTENEGSSESKVGRTGTLSRTKNPDWSDVFTFNFDRYKRQRWHFVVKDHDVLARDDKAGEAWVTVSDYVDKNEYFQVNLNKRGYLIIKKA